MPNIPESFGEELKRLRLDKDLSLRQLASKIIKEDGKPISPSYLNDIEKNNRIPSAVIVEKLARALEYDSDKLLALAQKIPPDAEKILKEDPAWGVLLRKAKEAGFTDLKAVERMIEEKAKKDHEENP